jgi:ATP phosphoribosyltransferase regulatory subunit
VSLGGSVDLEDLDADEETARPLRSALARKDVGALEQGVNELRAPAAVSELLLALPTLYGHGDVLERAGRLVKNARSEAALANLAEVYRLLRIYGLADAVLLDLGEVRGFDYYSGLHFEAYVSGFGTSVAGGGRYDQMLARFGFDCPAVGFAFDVGGLLTVMESQGVAVDLGGPDFFIIDFTPEKTAALSLARRLRDLGASVARDIVSRGLDDSLTYARAQRVRRVLVVGSPRTRAGWLLDLELASGRERELEVSAVLSDPGRSFQELQVGGDDA